MAQLRSIRAPRAPRAPRLFSRSRPSSKPASGNVAWSLIGPGKEHLLEELDKLYWEGVKADLENIIRTLKEWQHPEHVDVTIGDENDGHVYGFDRFIDQVSRESRKYANYKRKEHENGVKSSSNGKSPKDYRIKKVEYYRDKIKSEIKMAMDGTPKLKGMQQRAWMLLQSAGFLDLEKLIEHRPPANKPGTWSRPAIPQLSLSKLNKDLTPKFEPLRCTQSSCKRVICGSMFISNSPNEQGIICENCYRLHHYANESFSASYKHCTLSEAITPEMSKQLCSCKLPTKFDSSGNPINLFPVTTNDDHTAEQKQQCNLFKLRGYVAQAKYQGLLSLEEVKEPSKFARITSKFASGKKQIQRTSFDSKAEKIVLSVKEDGEQAEAQADKDIPPFLRKHAQKYPFANVHMALRVGPLVIENGVPQSKGGVLVTFRELPVFHERFRLKNKREDSLAIDGSADRNVLKRQHQAAKGKRYSAIMKQVIGVPFSGVLPHDAELQIVNDLLAASRAPFDNSNLPVSDRNTILDSVLNPILSQLRILIQSRVKIYLQSIARRLLSPSTTLAWNATNNNCQTFCDSLIDHDLFLYLFNGPSQVLGVGGPLYTMSFVCPDEGYTKQDVKTHFDVPKGLTEEYLLRFRFGRYYEADIIDTCQEYWHDWGAFGGSIYPYQDLFPWDCTEAYRPGDTKCGQCNLAKHVWAFPFDAWSMIALHLSRDSHMYAPANTNGPTAQSQHSWLRNRLQVLTAASILHRVAAAMAKSRSFCRATAWLHEDIPQDESLSLIRVKLGGIHRAQPFSHYFEAGKGIDYWVAPWALQPRSEQIQMYERLRDRRHQLSIMPPRLVDAVHDPCGNDEPVVGADSHDLALANAATTVDESTLTTWNAPEASTCSPDAFPFQPGAGSNHYASRVAHQPNGGGRITSPSEGSYGRVVEGPNYSSSTSNWVGPFLEGSHGGGGGGASGHGQYGRNQVPVVVYPA
ncbi:hypothetical protein B0J13DRAFT_157170 [Dactylonectria estremocensis]|uniref:Uncharacterized protein n=1 Tax=Dactylonectria estremocensis TaxID=1079267 RepID=A0A9P9DMP2_9HYPO|nr:hypothetical protein B0J13DRAFT_157170 [Dactylonectria estremocensis]